MRTAQLFLLALAAADCAADFCSSGEDGAPESYIPLDAAEVPDEVLGVILDSFPDANLTLNEQPFTGCSNISVSSVLLCTQVVSGKNYKVLAAIKCEEGTFDYLKFAVLELEALVEAVVYQPLDGPAELSSMKLVGSASISTDASPMCLAGVSVISYADVPEDVGALMLKTVVDVASNKSCNESHISHQPACVAETGSDYLLTSRLTCIWGYVGHTRWAMMEILEVRATIFDMVEQGGETAPVLKNSSTTAVAHT